MGKLIAATTSLIATFVALTSSGASWMSWFDEAEMPESLLK